VNATQTLPPSYQRQGTLDLSKQPLMMAALSLGSILLGGLAVGMMLWVLPLLRPDLIELSVTIGGLADLLRFLLIALIVMVVMVVMVVLHEGLHGLMFWHFTGDRPTFGFKGLYAYAAAPNWYLPRNQHLVVALAPLIVMTLGGLLLVAVLPEAAVLPIIAIVALNAGGAIGDILAALWLLRVDAAALVQDTGDAMTVFRAEDPVLRGESP
jgi:hypothetical protein